MPTNTALRGPGNRFGVLCHCAGSRSGAPSRPHERRAVPLIILATVLMDAVLLSHGLGVTGLWYVPVFVLVALLAVPAALLSGVNRRQRIAYGVLVGVGVTTVLILAVVVLVTVHDAPFF